MKLLKALSILTSRPVLLAVAGGALLLLLGECTVFRDARRAETAPRIAVNVPQFERYRPEAIEATIRTWRPPEREAKRIARELDSIVKSANSDKGADLLAHKEVAVDCGEGGTRRLEILATLPEGEGPREVEIRTRQSAGSFWSLRGAYGIGALYGTGSDGERWRAYGFAEPLRVGRVRLRGEAGVESRAGVTDWYAMVGGEIRF